MPVVVGYPPHSILGIEEVVLYPVQQGQGQSSTYADALIQQSDCLSTMVPSFYNFLFRIVFCLVSRC